eukprot:422056_1
MFVDLRLVQFIDQQVMLLVYGYNRAAQALLSNDSTYYNIPKIAYHLCALFCWQGDYFKTYGDIKVTNNGLKATTHTGGWNTVYGDLLINNKKYYDKIIEYDIEFNVTPGYGAIGIVSTEIMDVDQLIWRKPDNHKVAYAFHNSSLYNIGGCEKSDSCAHIKGEQIRMIVNISQQSLTFWSITRKKQLGKYDKIDYSTTFRFAISMTGQQLVNLLNFTIKEC